ncbi:Site-specific recombinase XerD [Sphingomonas gellani]|uniref:Site-specific recombinase XerD n=1 Tax=Sphingomonas gellani TaxID=1166340 RepID=A0A1H8AT34_9SPHN|nr:integrase arm-type DNA-binding domain-containing protein [Sphingomonas gellani]SEM73713.1 Site-specific recombinase XerD [Sphingomonas gellani]
MLTNAAVKAARPRAAAYKLTDERGLHLFVAPTGLKSFRWRFRLGGKEQLLTIGEWPNVSLDEARDQVARAREQLANGQDPRTARSEEPAQVRAFEYVARRWHAESKANWTDVHAADVLVSLERDIFPAIGTMPIAAITPPVILNALRVIEERGSRETARRIRQRISAVFAFAITEELVDSDPSAFLARRLKPAAPARHHPALTDIDDARSLLVAVDQLAAAPATVLASRFLALTAVRLAAVRGACWSEIEDLDGPEPLWRVPAARVKMRKADKSQAERDHLVPLSPAAVEVLRAARANMHASDANLHDALIFPGRGAGRPIGEAAIGALYDRTGYAGRHVPHGWRASFSTIMNLRAPDQRQMIEAVLGHVLKKEDGTVAKVEGAYNRAQHLGPRRALLEAWAIALVG